jgi:hypothetical protein
LERKYIEMYPISRVSTLAVGTVPDALLTGKMVDVLR